MTLPITLPYPEDTNASDCRNKQTPGCGLTRSRLTGWNLLRSQYHDQTKTNTPGLNLILGYELPGYKNGIFLPRYKNKSTRHLCLPRSVPGRSLMPGCNCHLVQNNPRIQTSGHVPPGSRIWFTLLVDLDYPVDKCPDTTLLGSRVHTPLFPDTQTPLCPYHNSNTRLKIHSSPDCVDRMAKTNSRISISLPN